MTKAKKEQPPRTTLTADQQIGRWVKGESLHNAAGECTPDFSCCRPHLLAPKETRKQYQRASKHKRAEMCAEFLAAALRNQGCKVETSAEVKGC